MSSTVRTVESAKEVPRWRKILLSAFLIALVGTTLELGSSWYLKRFEGYDGTHLLQYEFDPYKNIHLTPNYVNTVGIHHNGQGFRYPTEVERKKPAGTYRIFLMGGSAAYGLGGAWPHIQRDYAVLRDSETISAHLERYLRQSLPARNVEVINAAITSDWTHHHLIYLNQAILNYQPDMVLFLDGFNDFFFFDESHDQFASYAYQERARVIMGEPTFYSLAYANAWWLFRNCAFANAAMRALHNVRLRLLRAPPGAPPIDVEKAMAGLHQVFPRSALAMDRRIGLILRDAGVTAVFMLQPLLILERDQKPMPPIEGALFEFDVRSYPPGYEALIHAAVPYIREQEEKMARDVGAQFIDLTRVYAGVPQQAYTDYCHLTPLGNEIVARHIGERLLPLISAIPVDGSAPDARGG